MTPPDGSISVVIPSYNRRDLLRETLGAVLAQSRPALEVIVVDDGSQDGSADMTAAEFPNVRLIRIPNSGELVARNTGVRAASGGIVAFCDSDDLWSDRYLERVHGLWLAEPGLRVAYANFRHLRDGKIEQQDKFASAPAGWFDGLRMVGEGMGVFDRAIVERMIGFTPFFPSAMAVARSDFLAQGGWDESVGRTVGCDFATSLRMAESPPIGVLTEPLVAIRKHDSNYSGDLEKMNLGDAFVLDHVLARRPSLAAMAEDIKASARARRIMALERAFSRGDLAAVRRIRDLLGDGSLPARVALKCTVAALPAPIGAAVARPLLWAGTMRGALTGR